jgi:hypothetical protein
VLSRKPAVRKGWRWASCPSYGWKRQAEKSLRLAQDRPGQDNRFGLVVAHLLDAAVGVDLQDRRSRHCEQDRRVSGDHKLRALLDQVAHPAHKRETTPKCRCGFWLI